MVGDNGGGIVFGTFGEPYFVTAYSEAFGLLMS